jgi:hypothetical protein
MVAAVQTKVKQRSLTDNVMPLNVRGGVDPKSIKVVERKIEGRWSDQVVILDRQRLCDALEYLLNRTLDDLVVASFIRQFGVTLSIPFRMTRSQYSGYGSEFEDSDDFTDDAASWVALQTSLTKIWRGRVKIGKLIKSIPFPVRLREGDMLVPDRDGTFTLELGVPESALLVCLQTIPLRYLRQCANAACNVMPFFIADRKRRKYCSDTCFRRGLEQSKQNYERKRAPRSRIRAGGKMLSSPKRKRNHPK